MISYRDYIIYYSRMKDSEFLQNNLELICELYLKAVE